MYLTGYYLNERRINIVEDRDRMTDTNCSNLSLYFTPRRYSMLGTRDGQQSSPQ